MKLHFGRAHGVDLFLATQDGKLVIERVENVAPVLEANKRSQNDERKDTAMGRKVASIPVTLYYDMVRQGLIDRRGIGPHNWKRVRRWLNDPDYRLLRAGGRL